MLYEITGGIVVLTTTALVLLYVYQSKLLYYPTIPNGSKTEFLDASQYLPSGSFKEVFFKTTDDVNLQAYIARQSKPEEAYTLLFFHDLSHRLPNIRELYHRVGVNVMILSYRGYGKSEGIPSENGLKLDAEAALNYLISEPDINPKKLVLFGRSLGGAVAFSLASNSKFSDKIKGVIVENTFSSIGDMVDKIFPILSSVKFLSTNKWESASLVKNISTPILFLSGLKDSLVPPSQMKQLHDLAENSLRKKFVVFPEGEHMDLWVQPGYYQVIKDYLDSL